MKIFPDAGLVLIDALNHSQFSKDVIDSPKAVCRHLKGIKKYLI